MDKYFASSKEILTICNLSTYTYISMPYFWRSIHNPDTKAAELYSLGF